MLEYLETKTDRDSVCKMLVLRVEVATETFNMGLDSIRGLLHILDSDKGPENPTETMEGLVQSMKITVNEYDKIKQAGAAFRANCQ
ncbi:MAG: hypothetical protein PVG59_22240 [Desulfobacterales bacterium]